MRYLFVISILFFSININSQICGSGDIRLQTQLEVDNFSTTYPNCNSINGILRIAHSSGGPTDITNLNGLTQLTSINQLIVGNNPNLTSFSGLENIDFNSVSKISINNNPMLSDISQLNAAASLTSAGEIAIKDCGLIGDNDLSILQNVTSFGTALQLNNLAITNVDYLTSVTNIARALTLANNSSLTNLSGLSNLSSFGGSPNDYIQITNNPLLNTCGTLCDIIIAELGTNTIIDINMNQGLCATLTDLLYECYGSGYNGIYTGDGTAPPNTSVTIPDVLNFVGDISVSGQILGPSDQRLKLAASPIERSLSLLNQLKPVEYNFNVEKFTNLNLPEQKQFGLLAQDVETVFPSLVKEFKTVDGEEYKSVNYHGLISLLIASIQEQQKEIDLLKKQIKD